MVQYKNILIPVDGSEALIKAFKQAVHIAERNDAAIYLVAILDKDNADEAAQLQKIRTLYSMNLTDTRGQTGSRCTRKCALAALRK